MNPQGADLLSQLKDIHGAPAAPWWPPAPGWWVLGLFVAIGLFILFRSVKRRYLERQRRAVLVRFVDHVEEHVDPMQSPQEFLSSLNRIFKIVALRAFPDHRCALMQGREWVEFVQQNMDNSGSGKQLSVLATGPYEPRPEFEAESLAALARRWIRQYG